jgi:hypothetical protein
MSTSVNGVERETTVEITATNDGGVVVNIPRGVRLSFCRALNDWRRVAVSGRQTC